jgi:hypothetical protein
MPLPDNTILAEQLPKREWLIKKNGYFYRPERSGYTRDVIAAGLYTEGEARAEAAIEPDCMAAIHASEFAVPIEAARELLSRFTFI